MNIQMIHQNQSNELALMGGDLTMSSREIAELTGKRHGDVMRDIRQMFEALGEDQRRFASMYRDSYGREQSQYELNKELTLTLLLGYDVKARLKVVRRWQELEQQARLGFDPNNRVQLFEQLLIQAKENQTLQTERDEAVRTKALIGSKREATAMATASAAKRESLRLKNELGKGAKQATIAAVSNATGKAYPRGSHTPLRRWCVSNGVTPNKVPDDRYGEVVAWPAGAWLACFDVDLTGLFGGKK